MDNFLSWRKTRSTDLPECLQLHPARNGADRIGIPRALEAWKALLGLRHATRSSVIELHHTHGTEIVGFGFGVFVKKTFADAELQKPAPGLNCRIIESVLNGNSVVATYQEVREANTRSDISQVVLDTSWKQGRLKPEQVQQVRIMLAESYQELYAGYRLSKIISELVDDIDFWHVQGLRPFQIVDRFHDHWQANPNADWNRNRALIVATAESMRDDPGSVAAGLFNHHRAPRFAFTREEQELLEVAIEGLDDQAATQALFVTLPAIKRRWQNIFHRVADRMPDLCPPDGDGTRGIQKRQRILTYIRSHPEELRPFDCKNIPGPRR